MVAIPAGRYRVGSDEHYPEERPAREVEVAAFSHRRDAGHQRAPSPRFVAATGYVDASRSASSPAGSAVFVMTPGPVDLRDPSQWWRFVARRELARTRTEPARRSTAASDHPVVHVALEDAQALRDLAREAPADGGRVGSGGARRARRTPPTRGATSSCRTAV